MDNRVRTMSKGYVATILNRWPHTDVYGPSSMKIIGFYLLTDVTPAIAPAVNRRSVPRSFDPDPSGISA